MSSRQLFHEIQRLERKRFTPRLEGLKKRQLKILEFYKKQFEMAERKCKCNNNKVKESGKESSES